MTEWCLKLENLLSGSLRISAPSAFELPFNAENAEIRRGRRENRSIYDCHSLTIPLKH